MDLRKVKKLIELFEASELVEMEISEGESTIRLNRGGSHVQPMISPLQMSYSPMVSQAPSVDIPATTTPQESTDAGAAAGEKITSPMVGTFYDAASTDTDPYVAIGSVVKPGDVLCIIEAMKTFNQFEAETAGTIKAIYKHSGDPVEFGEPLFLID